MAMAVHLAMRIVLMLQLITATAAAMQYTNKQTYVVHAPARSMPSQFNGGSIREWHSHLVSSVVSRQAAIADKAVAGMVDQERILYSYGSVLQGFAVRLTAQEAAELKAMEGVLAAVEDRVMHVHTTRTPLFMGLETRTSHTSHSHGLWEAAKMGKNVIVGVFDTGIWPERRSFSDDGFSPVPRHWKGKCETSATFNASSCNRKLIGARVFYKGYEAAKGPMSEKEFKSPRDSEGHGTHTSSTAAGNAVSNANIFHFAAGNASGIAPAARIAVYKTCWLQGCYGSDTLAAFEAAITDGVDIISISSGGKPVDYFQDVLAIGSFAAVSKGILVSCSAGNSGPGPKTSTNLAPWIFTIAASSVDRNFPARVVLGNGRSLPGLSVYSGKGLAGRHVPLIYGGNAALSGKGAKNASLCLHGYLDPKQVKGKIVFCERGVSARVAKGFVVGDLGAVGMILGNNPENGLDVAADAYMLPAAAMSYKDSKVLKHYINENVGNATATIDSQGTKLHVKPAPIMAAFSSRGPNQLTPEILKPDITAPGVNILAAWTGGISPSGMEQDERRVEFNLASGTSMSCPHVSGLAALLKAAQPSWSPAAIKSALMTSAVLHDNTRRPILDVATNQASLPIAHGAGHVQPNAALNPGLIYDLTTQDYLNFLCGLHYSSDKLNVFMSTLDHVSNHKCSSIHPSNLNYPSFSVIYHQSTGNTFIATFSRIVTNVGPAISTYNVSIIPPTDVHVSVEPSTLAFNMNNQKLSYSITFKASASTYFVPEGTEASQFGSLTWFDGYHKVHSPIMFTWAK